MNTNGPGVRVAAALMVALAGWTGLAVSSAQTPPVSPAVASETRALWVLRTSLTSPDSIASLVSQARQHGFNTLLVQVRGRGDAYFRGGREPLPADLLRQPETFDPLAAVLSGAHGAGLRVHAWVNVNLVSSAVDLPIAREHLVYRHPSWLMVPRDIARDMARTEPESPAYVGKLARWTRAQATEIEGLYASPIVPEAAEYLASIVTDLTRRYPIDGIHFDYARYPSDRFDYSRAAIRQFRASLVPSMPEATRRALDTQDAIDVFAYPDAFPEAWRRFRVARMTALVARLRSAALGERPGVFVSASAAPDARDAFDHRFQDWRTWLSSGIIDAICPMAYTTEPAKFAEQIAAAREAAGSRPVWAGIGAYRLSPQDTIDNIQTARRLGAAGVVLFSYDSLVDPRQAMPDYLSMVGRAAFAARAATSPGSR